MKGRRRYDLLLAVYLTPRGYAWVLFEGPHSPVDWGVVRARRRERSSRTTEGVIKLIERFHPDAVILEGADVPGSPRPNRVHKINAHLTAYIEGYGLPVYRYCRNDVNRTFSYLPIATKDTIAEEIARIVPALTRLVPPRRKAWMAKHARMGLFEAAALVLTHYGAEVIS
jgi:hypothetical protein